MPLPVAYRRVLGLIGYGLFKIPSKSAVWLGSEERSNDSPRVAARGFRAREKAYLNPKP
jgi:hypothetical protein